MNVTTITSKYRLGSVNAFLLQDGDRAVLVDAGIANRRADFLAELSRAGLGPGQLPLVVVTHADGDHTGNCAYLQREWGAKVAVHPAEAASLRGEPGFLNRRPVRKPGYYTGLVRLLSRVVGIGAAEPCAADIELEDGLSLAPYGVDARVVHVPGHSNGSVAVLAADGSLCAGGR